MTKREVEDLIYLILRLEGRPMRLREILRLLPEEAWWVYRRHRNLLVSLQSRGKVRFDGYTWEVKK